MRSDTRRLLERAGLVPRLQGRYPDGKESNADHPGGAPIAVEMGGGSGTSILRIGGVVAKHYRPDFDDYSGLGPVGTADKVVAVARELPPLGVPVPAVIDNTVGATEALVVSEAFDPQPFTQVHRVTAARILRNLHMIEPQALSPELGGLVGRSRPNADRIRLGVEEAAAALDRRDPAWPDTPPGVRVNVLLASGEPPPGTALVHGDYFSANLPAVGDGVVVIDWDLLSLGDPMWDLAFLVGADRDLDPDLIDRVLDAYGREAIDAAPLLWHRECWSLFWELRDLLG